MRSPSIVRDYFAVISDMDDNIKKRFVHNNPYHPLYILRRQVIHINILSSKPRCIDIGIIRIGFRHIGWHPVIDVEYTRHAIPDSAITTSKPFVKTFFQHLYARTFHYCFVRKAVHPQIVYFTEPDKAFRHAFYAVFF